LTEDHLGHHHPPIALTLLQVTTIAAFPQEPNGQVLLLTVTAETGRMLTKKTMRTMEKAVAVRARKKKKRPFALTQRHRICQRVLVAVLGNI